MAQTLFIDDSEVDFCLNTNLILITLRGIYYFVLGEQCSETKNYQNIDAGDLYSRVNNCL